jgi:C_GCAxxG_C_C family probable redox protein
MSERSKRGREIYENNYNCAEATWLALNEDLPEEFANFGLQLAGGFGGGFCSGKVCGAIAGAVMALGRHYGRKLGEPRPELLKEKVQKLMAFVEAEYKSAHCHELRPVENQKPFCAALVERVIEYTEMLISE